MARQPDGSVQMERATPQGVSIRKRFFFPPTDQKKDNYVSEMQIDFRNDGQQPQAVPGYFIALGSTRPIHPKDLPTDTRLVWCIKGKPKGVDVTSFEGSGGFLGLGQHAGAAHLPGDCGRRGLGRDEQSILYHDPDAVERERSERSGRKRVRDKAGRRAKPVRNGRRDEASRL